MVGLPASVQRMERSYLATVQQIARERVSAARGSFRASEDPRRRSNPTLDGTADWHCDADSLRRLRVLSRDLERNSHLYDGFLSNWACLLVGERGPQPIFSSSDDAWSAAAADAWALAADDRDASGMLSWSQLVATLARSTARDGDALAFHDGSGRVAIYEADRVAAVRRDPSTNRILAYGLAPLDANGRTDTSPSKLAWVDASDADLIAWRTRSGQTRGAPVCAASLNDWERLDSLVEAEIITAETCALPWAVLEQQQGVYNPGALLPAISPSADSAPSQAATKLPGWQHSDAGHLWGLPPGLSAKVWTPTRPNMDIPAFIITQLRHMCLPLLPYEVAFLDINGLSYAATRGLGKLGELRLAQWRSLLRRTLLRIVRDWLDAAMLFGALAPAPAGWSVDFVWPKLDIRDREKDASSDAQELRNGTTTLQAILGPDWRRVQQQRLHEQLTEDALNVQRILELHKAVQASGIPDLHWSHLATLPGSVSAPGAYLGAAAPAPATAQESANP